MDHGYAAFKHILEEVLESNYSVDVDNVRTWTSMQALIAVSAIDEHYDVLVTHDELASVGSAKELFSLVSHKKS